MMRYVFVCMALFAFEVRAEAYRELNWDDLVPPAEPLVDPLEDLAPFARDDVYFIYHTEANIAGGFTPPDGEARRMADERLANLTSAGVDVPALLVELDALKVEIDRREQAVLTDLDRSQVRMPGYALPLEMSEEGVTEFLLVPYVGACIHTPPPPPNQMVLVELDEPYRINSLYDAVWITGEMRVQPSSMALSYVDGEAMVEAGYRVKVSLIEPYQ